MVLAEQADAFFLGVLVGLVIAYFLYKVFEAIWTRMKRREWER